MLKYMTKGSQVWGLELVVNKPLVFVYCIHFTWFICLIPLQVSHLPQCSMAMGRYAVHPDGWDSPLAHWDLRLMSFCHCIEQVSTCGSSTSVLEDFFKVVLKDTAGIHVGVFGNSAGSVSAVWSMG